MHATHWTCIPSGSSNHITIVPVTLIVPCSTYWFPSLAYKLEAGLSQLPEDELSLSLERGPGFNFSKPLWPASAQAFVLKGCGPCAGRLISVTVCLDPIANIVSLIFYDPAICFPQNYFQIVHTTHVYSFTKLIELPWPVSIEWVNLLFHPTATCHLDSLWSTHSFPSKPLSSC